VLLMAIWWVWSVTALATDLYRSQRPPIHIMTIWVMFGSTLMAAALPAAFTGHATVFAGAHVAIHLGRGLFLALALHRRAAATDHREFGQDARRTGARAGVASAVPGTRNRVR
jgi:low temperature requirement protein LtrA